jgi:tetratricopeptide (TPR) repeat protein
MNKIPEVQSVDHALDEIAHLVQSANYPQARARCEALLGGMPLNADALVWLGRIAMNQLRWDDAIEAFDRALRIRVDPKTLGDLGMCHWKVGHLGEAEYCLRGALELNPALTREHIRLSIVQHALQRFDAALAQLALAEKLDPHDNQVPMRGGCALAALGRFDEAHQAFEKSVQLAGHFNYARLVAFDRATFDAVTGAEEIVTPPQVALQAGDQGGAFRYVTLISCNPPYMRKFGFAFVRSYAEHSKGDNLLHLHVYDPTAPILGDLERLLSQCGVEHYVVTTEACPFPAHETRQRKAYYACGRLVHLPYWLDRYRCPVLSLDVDFIVESSLDNLIDAARQADAGLNLRDPVDSPWLDVIANIIVANPTPAARRYFAAVKNYALDYIRREPEAWLVDQSALYCVLKMMERFDAPPAITWIPKQYMACLWHIGHAYEHLLDDPRYRKYAEADRA